MFFIKFLLNEQIEKRLPARFFLKKNYNEFNLEMRFGLRFFLVVAKSILVFVNLGGVFNPYF